MTDRLWVDTDSIAATTPALRELAAHTHDVATSLGAQLAAIGPARWDDPIGQAFTAQYEGPAASMRKGFEDTATVVARTADGVHGMARGFESTEQNIVDAIRVHGVTGDSAKGPAKASSANRK
ncbi:hypothetical protein ACH4E7_39205 [Kitasatospora sp. NPDC018058]|uniref:hypothetical protein n=1 Tax=Kitasatospora sp. NPDC018058 TaxID=3364025 RepID=UPI0037BE684D